MNRLKLLLVITMVLICEVGITYTQTAPPNAGRYSCLTTQLSNAPGAPLGAVIFIPAVFGNVVLDGKGNYKLPTLKKSGLYRFDKTTSQLIFTTGDMRAFKVSRPGISNGVYRFLITYDTISYECSHQPDGKTPADSPGADQKTGKPTILNQGLKGSLLISTSSNSLGYLSSVYTLDLATGNFGTIFSDGVAAQNSKGEILYVDKTYRVKITDQTGNKTLQQIPDKILASYDAPYPAISNSGEFYALTLVDTVDSGIFGGMDSGGIKVSVFRRNGQKIADFKGYTQAAWTPTGELIVAGDGNSKRGLFIIDAKFKSVKRLVEEFETAQMPAVSPDGKTVAFVKNGEIWTVGIDGKNPVVEINGNSSSFPTWSPDGKYIAAVVRAKIDVTNQNLIFVAKVKSSEGFYLTDKNNKNILGGNRISWVSDVPIASTTATPQIQNSEPKISTNSLTAYTPTTKNQDPNFAKAYETYLQVMGNDLDNYNDVAAAITYIVVLNYAYRNNLDGVPTNRVQQVYKQFVEKLSQTKGFKSASNETKQQLAELAIMDGIETLNAINSNDQNKINEVTLRLMKKYVGNVADKLKITDNGMEY